MMNSVVFTVGSQYLRRGGIPETPVDNKIHRFQSTNPPNLIVCRIFQRPGGGHSPALRVPEMGEKMQLLISSENQ